jgi:hypothetical protein
MGGVDAQRRPAAAGAALATWGLPAPTGRHTDPAVGSQQGIDDADIEHARRNATRLIEYDYDGEERLLVIGPDRHGVMLELVAVPAGEAGDSWTVIGAALDITRQAAQQRFGNRPCRGLGSAQDRHRSPSGAAE